MNFVCLASQTMQSSYDVLVCFCRRVTHTHTPTRPTPHQIKPSSHEKSSSKKPFEVSVAKSVYLFKQSAGRVCRAPNVAVDQVGHSCAILEHTCSMYCNCVGKHNQRDPWQEQFLAELMCSRDSGKKLVPESRGTVALVRLCRSLQNTCEPAFPTLLSS